MVFAVVPSVSKMEIDRVGESLKNKSSDVDFFSAIQLVNQWRACHAYPINTFQSTLRTKIRDYPGNPIVAQRLKRMPTIIDKLRRYPSMQLTRMQDIGGVRAILGSVKDVYNLANDYRNNKFFLHELYNEKDYIKTPRNVDGYRSLHLMYKYKNQLVPGYNNLRIELQIRTKLQHIWATAVETMGTFLGQALKSRQGDKEWLDFFATVSSAFACMEKTAVLPRHERMSKNEIFNAVAEAENKLSALDIMSGFYTAAKEISKRSSNKGWSYHLIILNSIQRTVQVIPFNRDELDKAVKAYSKIEAEAVRGKKIEPVLVSAGPLNTLKHAYPNFFLDISEFFDAVNSIVRKQKIYNLSRQKKVKTTRKYH